MGVLRQRQFITYVAQSRNSIRDISAHRLNGASCPVFRRLFSESENANGKVVLRITSTHSPSTLRAMKARLSFETCFRDNFSQLHIFLAYLLRAQFIRGLLLHIYSYCLKKCKVGLDCNIRFAMYVRYQFH